MRALLLLALAWPAFGTYTFHRTVTIDHTKVPGVQSGFPMLFYGTYTWLRTAANGGNVQNSSGYDIVFSSDSAGTTLLACEQQLYDAATGVVTYWVKIPSLSSTVDTVIYIQYGDGGISTPQCAGTTVWTGYKAVYHLNETTGSYADATGNGYGSASGTYPTRSTGQFGYAQSFNGSTNYIQFPNPITTGTTWMSAWIKTSTAGSGMADNGVPADGVQAFLDGSGKATTLDADHGGTVSSSAAANNNAWHHFAAVDDTLGIVFAILDGVSVFSGYIGTPGYAGATNMRLGSLRASNSFNGLIEEFRVANTNLGANWAATETNNQSSPSTFYSISGPTGGGRINVFPILF